MTSEGQDRPNRDDAGGSGAVNALMTLSELAAYLRVAEKTVLRMVKRGDLPGTKVSGQWRFMRGVIDEWLMSGMKSSAPDDLFQMLAQDDVSVPLSRLLGYESIVVGMGAAPQREVLEALVAPLHAQGVVRDGDAYLRALLAREELASTAMGRGVALPHAREPGVGASGAGIVCGVAPEGIDFGAPDGGAVQLFFLICADSVQLHLRLMARVGLVLRDQETTGRLKRAATRDDVVAALLDFEQRQLVSG